MAAADTTTLAAIMKRRYVGKLQTYQFAVDPIWGMLPKDTEPGFVGEFIAQPIRHAATGGRSASFATAIANERGTSSKQWLAPVSEDFSTAEITGKVIDMTRNREGAFEEAVMVEMDGARDQISQSFSQKLWHNGGGSIGKISSISVNTVTLTKASDVHNFSINMKYDTSTTDGTSGSVDGNPQLCTEFDEDAGTVTFSAVTGFAAGEFLFADGDFGAAFKGIPAIIPTTAPTSTLFYNVDRSVSRVALAGTRYTSTASDGDLEQLGINVMARLERSRGKYPTSELVWCMHPNDMAKLINTLGAKAIYDKTQARGSDGDVGYKMLAFASPSNQKTVVTSSSFVPEQDSWMITTGSWKWFSAGETPKVMDYGTGQLPQLLPTSDSIRIRFGYRGALLSEMPGANAYVNLAALVS